MGRVVIVVVDDMFFASKIRAVAEAMGVEVTFPRTRESIVEKAREARLILVDLHNQKIDAVTLAGELKANKHLARIPLFGFLSHVEVELQRRALSAGFDKVVPRSFFARELPAILNTDNADDTD